MLPIVEEPYQLQEKSRPQGQSEPVDGDERQRLHEAERLCAGVHEQQHEQEHADDKPLGSLPRPTIIAEDGQDAEDDDQRICYHPAEAVP